VLEVPVPALHPITGQLPLGRHHCTMTEFESAFVPAAMFAASNTRRIIWQDWTDAVAAIRSVVSTYAAWVSGSFASSKTDPNDMDIVFIVDGDMVDALPQASRMRSIIGAFASGPRFHQAAGRRLDTYIIPWYPIPDPANDVAQRGPIYYNPRGHWDDFWQRLRDSPKGTPATATDCNPKRGYLEVKLDEYPS
jgi:Family of unknown function (DUF6932)